MTCITFYEAFEEEAAALRRYLPDHIKAVLTPHTIQESAHTQPPSPIISVRTQSQFSADALCGVEAVLTRSTGHDHIDALRKDYGFDGTCGYLPIYCNRAVAEQAALLAMALLRRLPAQMRQIDRFDRDGLTGRECRGRTLGVFGVGNIGSEVVKIGSGLGMEVLGVDIAKRHPGLVQYVPSRQALNAADVIVCCMNLTEENVGYFDADAWEKARPGAVFVNIARGELSPAEDLYQAISSGRLSGVGLDVYPHEADLAVQLRGQESGGKVNDEVEAILKLKSCPNVIFTPHNAFNTLEAVERKARQSVQQIEYYLEQQKFEWPV